VTRTGVGHPAGARRLAAAALTLALGAALALPALADWLQPDPSFKDAQYSLRAAQRDTVGQGRNAVRLDTLAIAHLRLAHFTDARRLFRRVIAIDSLDVAARAGLARLALFADRPAETESLLAGALDADDLAPQDLLAAHIRLRRWTEAATLAESLGMSGRAEMLSRMAEGDTGTVSGNAEVRIPFMRLLPVPLVRVKLNGQSVLMAIDLGAGDLLVDDFLGRQAKVRLLTSQTPVPWGGTQVTVRNAVVQLLDLGGMRIENLPAGVLALRKWGLMMNPDGERVAGVIGLNLLRRFATVIDYHAGRLELRPLGSAPAVPPGARRVPFELWGESEMMVYGSIGGGRRMAMWVATGVPGCGIGAPSEVFEELGIKAGVLSRVMKGAGGPLQGSPWVQASVPGVVVGPVAHGRMEGASGAMDSGEMWRHGVRRDAVLAGDFFRGFRLTIDWTRHELVFEED